MGSVFARIPRQHRPRVVLALGVLAGILDAVVRGTSWPTAVVSGLVSGAVAIAGLPDERWGQKVVAFIEPACGDATAEKLDAYCQASALARFKRPRAYVFVERLPRSASGKLLRRLLRDGCYTALADFKSTL